MLMPILTTNQAALKTGACFKNWLKNNHPRVITVDPLFSRTFYLRRVKRLFSSQKWTFVLRIQEMTKRIHHE